jgi:exopolyphosphatase / guanosine-5'-triphosphate,3'-diphosphate pyrophosphatase
LEDPHSGARAPRSGVAGQGGDEDSRNRHFAAEANDVPTPPNTRIGSEAGQPPQDSAKKSRRRRRRKRGQSRDAAPSPAPLQAEQSAKPKRHKRRRGARIAGRSPKDQPGTDSAAAAPKIAAAPALPAAIFRPGLYAALDLGTNNCRLLIAAPTRPGQFRVVDAFSRIVRLGEGLTASGRLSGAAMDRALEALKICSDKLAGRSLHKARLIATEACRAAANGAEFLERVKRETGLELEIVDRETEARLAVSGCGPLVGREVEAIVLFDIGGGSSEVALIDIKHRKSPHLSDHIIAWTSLPVGVVSLAERYGGRHVSAETYQAMVDDVSAMIAAFPARGILGTRAKSEHFHLLGTSGTVTTLAGIHLGLERYDRRQVDGLWMSSEEVTAMTGKLLSWSFEERVANACIGAERADLVLGGCAILDAIRLMWPSKTLRVADRGLREGLLTEMMSSDGAWNRRPHSEARP